MATTRTSARSPATIRTWRTAETTHILRVKNRSGNVHDGEGGAADARPVAAAGGAAHGRGPTGSWMGRFSARMCRLQGRDVGCDQRPVLSLVGSAALHPGHPHRVPVAPGVTGFAVPRAETPWQIPVAVNIYRKRSTTGPPRTISSTCLIPTTGYEYSAVTHGPQPLVFRVWAGNHEKLAQLTGLAFHSVPTRTYAANSGSSSWCSPTTC